MHLPKFVATAVAAAFVAASPATLTAQTPTPKKQAVTIQPISSIVGFYSGEYERAVTSSVTLGLGASYADGFIGDDSPNDPTYFSTEGKVRFYPGSRPLQGFSFGGTVGFTRVSSLDTFCVFACSESRETESGPSVGFQLDYNWLLGRNENFAVALGAGGKRLFINSADDDLTVAYPTLRISVGFAF